MPKQPKTIVESPPPNRGRPKKADAMTPAERTRRYREKQKAQGLIKRYVTENTDPGRVQELTDLLRKAISERDYFKSEVQRLNRESEVLLARAIESERFHTITQKDLIVLRKQLAEVQRKSK